MRVRVVRSRVRVRLARVPPLDDAFTANLLLSASKLALSEEAPLRAASLHALTSVLADDTEMGFDADSLSDQIWSYLATGCFSANDAVRAQCYRAACASHHFLRPAWRRLRAGFLSAPGLPPLAAPLAQTWVPPMAPPSLALACPRWAS